jgi:hypothetical protein
MGGLEGLRPSRKKEIMGRPRLPKLLHCSLSPARSASIQRAEALGKRFQALKVVNRQKIVDMRQYRLHPAHARLVGFAPQQRVEPDQPVAAALQVACTKSTTCAARRSEVPGALQRTISSSFARVG